jgi:hypothetical protein
MSVDVCQASREGNWDLHITSLRRMTGWFFAYDRTNTEMINLETTHPDIFQDSFVVQRQTKSDIPQCLRTRRLNRKDIEGTYTCM